MRPASIFLLTVFLCAGCQGRPESSEGVRLQEPGAQKEMPAAGPVAAVSPAVGASSEEEWIRKGIEYLKNGELESAVGSFDQAIKLAPHDPKGYLILGQMYMRSNNLDQAIDTFLAASQMVPDNGTFPYLLAMSYGLKGDRDSAIKYAKESAEVFKNNQDQENFLKSVALVQSLSESESP